MSARLDVTENVEYCYLSQYSKTCAHSSSHVGTHGHVSVDEDPEILNDSNWLHKSAANSNGSGRDLMLTPTGRTPECFSLTVVELQPVG